MAQISHDPSYLAILDRLDAIGQKFKGQRIIRGVFLWLTTLVAASFIGAIAAHWIGNATDGRSGWIWVVTGLWAAAMVAATVVWFVKPMLIRTRPVQVARMLETRVPDLHNGLTNGVLLAEAADLQQSPWLPAIYQEIEKSMTDRPVSSAVRMSELNPVLTRCGIVALPLLITMGLAPSVFGHGFKQMFSPTAFVPKTGSVSIESVTPGDVTLVTGQPFEMTAYVAEPGEVPPAELIFENGLRATLTPTSVDTRWRYSYRLDHVDASTRYRLSVGGTDSRWYAINAVRQIKLKELTLKVTPPAYTGKGPSLVTVKPDAVEAVELPQGSRVDLSTTLDVPANGAMLQVGDGAPTAMIGASSHAVFGGSATITDDQPLAILVTDGSGQIVAKLPEQTLSIHAVKDMPPTIEMRWPTADATVAPDAAVKVSAVVKDDYGVVTTRVLVGIGADGAMTPVAAKLNGTDLVADLDLKPEQRKHGEVIRVQVGAVDGRDLVGILPTGGGPQTTVSSTYEIKFQDPSVTAKQEREHLDKLREVLLAMLKDQRAAQAMTVTGQAAKASAGQVDLQKRMKSTAESFPFEPDDRVVQKTLQVLVLNAGQDAVDSAAALVKANDKVQSEKLQTAQRRIVMTLESLLAMLNRSGEPTTQPSTKTNAPLVSNPDAFKKLDDALKQYMAEQKKLLDQEAGLAKKPVDNYDDKDKKLIAELTQAQDKLDTFMKSAVNDFSKNAEQDLANQTVMDEAKAIMTELTAAKDALQQQAVKIAVPAEENGLEGAQELTSNIERWLSNTPDRQQWTQEELPDKSDTPMPELPKQLQDMVGELMEQQEDLFDDLEDMNANITDSANKGIGWDAADGPIADMSAKGVTGNQLPNNNEMGGRSGEGRSGRSQGEFVGDDAVGKGGRNTPTRLDPTPFSQGQIKDTSKDPVGGATGGGKISGQGGEGLQGPVPPKMAEGMRRLATKQAEIRNTAERLKLQYHLDKYDNFKLDRSIKLMREVQSDLEGNHYQNALRERDVLLDDLNTSRTLTAGTVNVQQDLTPTASMKVQRDLNDAMKGELPPAWSEPLKEYYKKLSEK